MKKIILSGHAEFSTGMLSAIKMIFGEQEKIYAVTFNQAEGIDDLVNKFNQLVSGDDEVLFMVDLFGGSPYNAALRVAIQYEKVEVVAGVSLPLVFEAITTIEKYSVEETVTFLQKQSLETFKVFKKKEISNTFNEKEDEL